MNITFISRLFRLIVWLSFVIMALAGCRDNIEEVKQIAYKSGYKNGHRIGYGQGKQDEKALGQKRLQEVKKVTHNISFKEGYHQGYIKGEQAGLQKTDFQKEKDFSYRMGKAVGEKAGYEHGFDDGLKRVKSGFKEDIQGPMDSLKKIGVWLTLFKTMGMFACLIGIYTYGTKGDELIGKLIAMALGPVFMIFLIQSTQSYSGVFQFFLESGTQTGPYASFILLAIAVSTGVFTYGFYRQFIFARHSIWTETFCILIASAMLFLTFGLLHTLFEIKHDLGDFMIANISLAAITGMLFALMIIFIQRAEKQKTDLKTVHEQTNSRVKRYPYPLKEAG